MPDSVKEHVSAISELTGAQAVQAMLTLIVTITLMILLVLGRDMPEFLIYAWMLLLGIYMELPSKKASSNLPRS
jgi:hypothetical protein